VYPTLDTGSNPQKLIVDIHAGEIANEILQQVILGLALVAPRDAHLYHLPFLDHFEVK